MASFYAELEVAGHTYPVRMCKFDFTQATDERGRLSGKVRYGLIHLSLDVPHDDFLLNWGTAINKPLAGHVTFFETNQLTARETMGFTAGECVGYQETFESGNGGAGAYICHLTIAAQKIALSAGGPLRPFIPSAPRDYVHLLPTPLPATVLKESKPSKVLMPEVNLKLGPNEKYRDAIIKASERTGIEAAIIASIIDAEAEKKKGVWNPDSNNQNAVGLTQFLPDAWTDMYKKSGTILNDTAKKLGYIDEKNNVIPKYKKELFELRKNPEISIVTAAEYAKENIKIMERKNLISENDSIEEKAKKLYIFHHEGPTGGPRFLNNEMTEETAQYLLKRNIKTKSGIGDEERYNSAVEKHGSAKDAYQDLVWEHTNSRIKPDKFRNEPNKQVLSDKKNQA